LGWLASLEEEKGKQIMDVEDAMLLLTAPIDLVLCFLRFVLWQHASIRASMMMCSALEI
jgi:hypothetical protein